MTAAGRLTASIAHEINNPLQSLNNCLHLVGRRELSPEQQQKYLEMAQSELDRLMTTVQRMLELYRPGVVDRKMTDVNEIVRRVLMLLEPQLRKGKITVQTELSPDLPPIMAVASQIQQVLLNLILNSMEAMPDGGEISIHTLHPVPEANEVQAGVEILLADTGPGIPKSERSRVFEPFVSTKEFGTGLGLSVSYGIIAAHGGTLSLVDGLANGACFRTTLPKDENA
jgi:two-component system NtrC family sensor kinase